MSNPVTYSKGDIVRRVERVKVKPKKHRSRFSTQYIYSVTRCTLYRCVDEISA